MEDLFLINVSLKKPFISQYQAKTLNLNATIPILIEGRYSSTGFIMIELWGLWKAYEKYGINKLKLREMIGLGIALVINNQGVPEG